MLSCLNVGSFLQAALAAACTKSLPDEPAIPATEAALAMLRQQRDGDGRLPPDDFRLAMDILAGFLRQARPSVTDTARASVSSAVPAAAMSPSSMLSGSGSHWDLMASTPVVDSMVRAHDGGDDGCDDDVDLGGGGGGGGGVDCKRRHLMA